MCMKNKNYDKAVEHFANGLSLVEKNNELLNRLSKNLPQKMYGEVLRQIVEIQTMLPEIQMLNL